MFLSRASVARPIAMSCFILMLVLFGLNSYRELDPLRYSHHGLSGRKSG